MIAIDLMPDATVRVHQGPVTIHLNQNDIDQLRFVLEVAIQERSEHGRNSHLGADRDNTQVQQL